MGFNHFLCEERIEFDPRISMLLVNGAQGTTGEVLPGRGSSRWQYKNLPMVEKGPRDTKLSILRVHKSEIRHMKNEFLGPLR